MEHNPAWHFFLAQSCGFFVLCMYGLLVVELTMAVCLHVFACISIISCAYTCLIRAHLRQNAQLALESGAGSFDGPHLIVVCLRKSRGWLAQVFIQ